MLRLIVFDWRLERFSDAEEMSPATLWRIYNEYHAHQSWVIKQRKRKA